MDTGVLERLAVIEAKLDVFLAGNTDHESRLRKLEQKVWMAAGAASIVGASLTQLMAK